MKYLANSTVFHYKWEQISQAFWNRYPNPHATHVLSEDTFYRVLEDGKLFSKRLLTKKGSKVPKWGERFIPGNKQVYVVEESIVDPKSKTLTTYTRNIGLTRVMLIEEKCVYRPSPEDHNKTIVDREAFVSSSIFGFSRPLQSFGIDRFKRNIVKTVKGFEDVLGRMFPVQQISSIDSQKPITEAAQKLAVNKETLKNTANKAKELAKTKAASVVITN